MSGVAGMRVDWEEIRAAYNRKHNVGFLLLRDAVAHAYRNRTIPEAADRLGIGYSAMQTKIHEFGLQRNKKHAAKVQRAIEYFEEHGLDEADSAVAKKLGFSQTPIRTARKSFPDERFVKFDPWPGVMRWHNWKYKSQYATPDEMVMDLYAKLGSYGELAFRLQQNKTIIAKKLKEIGLAKSSPGRPREAS